MAVIFTESKRLGIIYTGKIFFQNMNTFLRFICLLALFFYNAHANFVIKFCSALTSPIPTMYVAKHTLLSWLSLDPSP